MYRDTCCSNKEEYLSCWKDPIFLTSFILISISVIFGIVIMFVNKLHNQSLISTIVVGFTAYLFTIGVILFGGFIEFLYALIAQIVSFILGIIAILLSININTTIQLKQQTLIMILIRFGIIGIIFLFLTTFYREFGSMTCICWCCVVVIGILFTPIILKSQSQIVQYTITFTIFVNLYEITLLYLLLMLSIVFVKRLECNRI
ncbi:unnamed protein product [Schistosoma guineensis]|nr:unnamed protein product [Schistosoma guineensis]